MLKRFALGIFRIAAGKTASIFPFFAPKKLNNFSVLKAKLIKFCCKAMKITNYTFVCGKANFMLQTKKHL